MTAALPRPVPGSKLPLLAAGALLAVALASAAAWVLVRNPSPSRVESPRASANVPGRILPSGVITYEIAGKGLFLANGAGETLGTTTHESLHVEGQVAAPVGGVPSPDGKWLARVVRDTAGVFLALEGADGVQRIVTQLAGSDDPALVAGGKGHARAVEGVPLVVAWSPDSQLMAFGTITGEPYSLGILRHPEFSQPTISYSEVSGGYVGELAWSPDGARLAISTYALDRQDHSILIADPQTGLVSPLIDGCHITWAPDSRYVAVHRDPGDETGAWVVSVSESVDRWAITREVQAFPLTWREG